MGDLKNASELLSGTDDLLTSYELNISLANLKKNVPRINLKKIKLLKANNIENTLVKNNITRLYLDDEILKLNFSFGRQISEYVSTDIATVKNPLRKKGDATAANLPVSPPVEAVQEPVKPKTKIPVDVNLLDEEDEVGKEPEQSVRPKAEIPVDVNLLDEEDEVEKEPEQPVTFNLEAQITQHGENVIYTPSTVSLPPMEENLLSTSGENEGLIWPPPSKEPQIKDVKNKSAEKQKKSKPYFISDETKREESSEIKSDTSSELPKTAEHKFPWSSPVEDYKGLDSIFGGGLEADLVDPAFANPPLPVESIFSNTGISDVQEVKEQHKPDLYSTSEAGDIPPEKVFLKAISPRYNFEQDKEILNLGLFNQDLGDNSLSKPSGDFIPGGKDSKMFEKSPNTKITPVKIIIVGGITVTAAYLIWTNFSSYFMTPDYFGTQSPDIVVRKLKKSKLTQRQTIHGLANEEEAIGDSKKISPISEEQRLTLIQKARESIEGRSDPFGQDTVLTAPVLEAAKTEKVSDKPEEIQVERKQFELVGVISVQSKNLALVNVYTADYNILLNDDKTVRENKLKQALSMAVPNRVEVSVLDPVEDWHVKAIIKGKTRAEDPYVELVKGDKKFTLKVGQKLLLPADKVLPEPITDLSKEEEPT